MSAISIAGIRHTLRLFALAATAVSAFAQGIDRTGESYPTDWYQEYDPSINERKEWHRYRNNTGSVVHVRIAQGNMWQTPMWYDTLYDVQPGSTFWLLAEWAQDPAANGEVFYQWSGIDSYVVVSTPTAPAVSLSISPSELSYEGGPAALEWHSVDATSVLSSDGFTASGINGMITLYLPPNYSTVEDRVSTYGITVIGPGGIASASATVRVSRKPKTEILFKFDDTSPTFTGSPVGPTIATRPDGAIYRIAWGTPSATDVGSYSFQVEADHPDYDGWAICDWQIRPKPVSFSFRDLDHTYDGREKTAAVSPDDGGATYSADLTAGSDVGTYPVNATAHGNYTGSGSATLTIHPKAVSFTFGDLEHTYDGSDKRAWVTADDPNATYSADLTAGPDAGTYTVTASAYGNYSGSGSETLTIRPAGQWVDLSPTTQTVKAGESVDFTASGGQNGYVWGGAASGSGSSNSVRFETPGNYVVTVSAPGGGNYEESNTAEAQITVEPNITPVTFTFSPLSFVYNGAAQGPGVSPSAAGATYSTGGTPQATEVGMYSISAEGTGTFEGAGSAQWVITKARPDIAWPTPQRIVYGTALSSAQLNATCPTPGRLIYNHSVGTVLPAGAHTLTVTFTPTDTRNYETASRSVTLVVDKATPSITWPSPAPIIYGERLGPTQQNATCTVPGTFNYTPAAGTVLPAGTHRLEVLFSPTDVQNYTTATAPVSLVVRRREITFSFSNLAHTYDGAPKEASVTCSDSSATYTVDATRGPRAGSYTVSAEATGNFVGSATATLVITRAPQVVSVTPAEASVMHHQPASFTAAGGRNGYVWGGTAGIVGTSAVESTTLTSPGVYSVTVMSPASDNYEASNTALATLLVMGDRSVTSLTPVANSVTIADPADPLHGRTYRRVWQEGGWFAYLGRSGVRFSARAQAWPSIRAVELQGQSPGGTWKTLGSYAPPTSTTDADADFSLMLDSTVPDKPLVPASYEAGAPLTGEWRFRARVQDAGGTWSAFSAEIPVEVVLPIATKSVSGQTVPPPGPVGDWFTPSPVQTFTLQFWIP